jgi:hypothetical protein
MLEKENCVAFDVISGAMRITIFRDVMAYYVSRLIQEF